MGCSAFPEDAKLLSYPLETSQVETTGSHVLWFWGLVSRIHKEMAKAKVLPRKYEDAIDWLRQHGFDLLEAPGTQGRVFLKKNNVSAAIERDPEGGARIFAYPGYLIGGEISKLINKGYQQVLKTTKTEIGATADHLKALHAFSEELKEALGLPSLYNESLGTVSESYNYDRVKDRDATDRPKRPWEKKKEGLAKKRA
jgi:hypothetical protein